METLATESSSCTQNTSWSCEKASSNRGEPWIPDLRNARRVLFLLLLTAVTADEGRGQSSARRAAPLAVPEEARAGLERLYQGDTRGAAARFRTLQERQPDHPLGYLLEANALWWERWCGSLEIKPAGFVDAALGQESTLDAPYWTLVAAAQQKADSYRKQNAEVAEAHLYLGLAYAMEGRLRALRRENFAAASAGKKMRAALQRALELDPPLDDALFGLGLYNYYVATLSPLLKLVRWLLFLPGGDKQTGLEQLERAAERGVLVGVEARFWLAKNLRNYDQDYPRARTEFERLSQRYPQNQIFALMLGGVEAKRGDSTAAMRAYSRARELAGGSSACDRRLAELATRSLEALSPAPTR